MTLAAAWLLTACGTTTPRTDRPPQVWSGRLSLVVESDPPQSWTASFELEGTPERGQLSLASPLGQRLASLDWSAAAARWQQGSQRVERKTLDELLDALGASALPVGVLFAWLDGQPQSAPGWQVDLSQHALGRIRASRAHPAPSAELRLVFER